MVLKNSYWAFQSEMENFRDKGQLFVFVMLQGTLKNKLSYSRNYAVVLCDVLLI